MVTARQAGLFLIAAAALFLPAAKGVEKQQSHLKDSGMLRLKAPLDLARTEAVVSKDSGDEGMQCVRGLKYSDWTEVTGRTTEIFSTSAASLKKAGRLQAVDHFLAAGGDREPLGLTDLVCSDAAIGQLAAFGSVESKVFDRQQIVFVERCQDSCCGYTEVVAVAKKGHHYFVLTVGLKALLEGYTCDPSPRRDDSDCATRDACLKAFFAKPANTTALKSKWRSFLQTLQFSY